MSRPPPGTRGRERWVRSPAPAPLPDRPLDLGLPPLRMDEEHDLGGEPIREGGLVEGRRTAARSEPGDETGSRSSFRSTAPYLVGSAVAMLWAPVSASTKTRRRAPVSSRMASGFSTDERASPTSRRKMLNSSCSSFSPGGERAALPRESSTLEHQRQVNQDVVGIVWRKLPPHFDAPRRSQDTGPRPRRWLARTA